MQIDQTITGTAIVAVARTLRAAALRLLREPEFQISFPGWSARVQKALKLSLRLHLAFVECLFNITLLKKQSCNNYLMWVGYFCY